MFHYHNILYPSTRFKRVKKRKQKQKQTKNNIPNSCISATLLSYSLFFTQSPTFCEKHKDCPQPEKVNVNIKMKFYIKSIEHIHICVHVAQVSPLRHVHKTTHNRTWGGPNAFCSSGSRLGQLDDVVPLLCNRRVQIHKENDPYSTLLFSGRSMYIQLCP